MISLAHDTSSASSHLYMAFHAGSMLGGSERPNLLTTFLDPPSSLIHMGASRSPGMCLENAFASQWF